MASHEWLNEAHLVGKWLKDGILQRFTFYKKNLVKVNAEKYSLEQRRNIQYTNTKSDNT